MKHIKDGTEGGWVVLLAANHSKTVLAFQQALEQPFLQTLAVVSDGMETLAYLHGEGKYADRVAYPFPNVVFIECRMPVLSGLGVLCWLRNDEQFRHLPVVLLSEGFSHQQVEMVFKLSAACCCKASAPREIRQAITRSVRLALAPEPQAESLLTATGWEKSVGSAAERKPSAR